MNKENLYKREFASFSGTCPYACLHCYTFNPNYQIKGEDSIPKIVSSLQEKNPNVIYISGHKENFFEPNQGLELAEKIFEAYHCNILMTTRNIFNQEELNRLAELNSRMKEEGKYLFFCISIPALKSYQKLENNPLIPTPYQRMEFLSEVYLKNIITFLTIKPLCPNEFISIEEPLEIIKRCKDYTTLVLSSGIIVDNSILKRLKTFPTTYEYQRAPLMECLENDLSVQYVDVTRELEKIQILCSQYGLPFFQHSMPAIEYIKKLKK